MTTCYVYVDYIFKYTVIFCWKNTCENLIFPTKNKCVCKYIYIYVLNFNKTLTKMSLISNWHLNSYNLLNSPERTLLTSRIFFLFFKLLIIVCNSSNLKFRYNAEEQIKGVFDDNSDIFGQFFIKTYVVGAH